ncbi:NAD-dependent epimerase/dehydratase family protein [Glacieibacterium megasporae]|uniref:NAD-dependent epimerase/dehydratase family protein n=1 Tax=Glacieibacterium megasporae TaxID=2835787 RepID=UPI001C1E4BB0|nr:GDP-mannose 4,6-dehydratase [Polymorphobacter megasporae]UAJ10488.1 GDP-mannose 4,6-dehydratase [Polymorphobacter megasporae]
MTRRALITGIEGFTGQYVAAELSRRGFEVHGTTRAASTQPDWHQVDLLDATALATVVEAVAPTHVVHLAAVAFVASNDVEAIYRVNIVGTRNLLSALAPHAAVLRAVVLASSASVYGNTPDSPIAEATPPRPSNDYAISKLAMEFVAAAWAERVPATVVRPFNYTGVGQAPEFLIPKIVAAFRRRAPVIELGNLDVAREFSDVRDVAADYADLVEAGIAETVNLCSGIAYSIGDVLAMATSITGHSIDVHTNPAFVRAGDIAHLAGDNARLRRIAPATRRRPFDETLRWMLEA